MRGPRAGDGERDPELPEEITGAELDRDVRAELRGLGTDYGKVVARHLVAVHQYLDEDPELAWRHAGAARRRAGRLASVREAAGLAAYRTGRWAEALSELRTARRLTGSSRWLPLMADSERGLGRPERALELARGPEAQTLDRDGRIELLIVAAGARTDLGELEAAVVALQVPELENAGAAPWLARLRYAYAEALAAAGRPADAERWRGRALEADPDGVAGLEPEPDEDDEVMLVDLEDDATPIAPPAVEESAGADEDAEVTVVDLEDDATPSAPPAVEESTGADEDDEVTVAGVEDAEVTVVGVDEGDHAASIAPLAFREPGNGGDGGSEGERG